MKNNVIIVGILIVMVCVPLGKKFIGGSKATEVMVEDLSKRVIRSSTLASGSLKHEEQVLVSTEIIGRVSEVLVKEGDTVKRGQLLLRIDDATFNADLNQTRAQVRMQEIDIERKKLHVENLQKQWQRTDQLFGQKLIDETSYDESNHQLSIASIDLKSSYESLAQARATLERAQERLEKTRVISPIDGMVTQLNIKAGEMAIASTTNVPGSSLMTIANPASIHAEVYVDEADVANIRVGQPAEVFAVAYPDQAIEGAIESIATSAGVAAGRRGLSFAVKIHFKGAEELLLKPGMSSRAEIFSVDAEADLSVPIQAIQTDRNSDNDDEQHYVFIEQNNRAKKIWVNTGVADDDYQHITGELEEGMAVIVGPDRELRNLIDGDRITIEETNKEQDDDSQTKTSAR